MPLAKRFARSAQRRFRGRRGNPIALSTATESLLRSYSWPGNIRELRNVMERATLLCAETDCVMPEHLPADKMRAHFAQAPRSASQTNEHPAIVTQTARVEKIDLRQDMKAHERQLIIQALDETGGNQTRAAKLLNISRRTLISRIEEFGLPRPRKRDRPR